MQETRPLSGAEKIKAASGRLRGAIAGELAAGTDQFTKDSVLLLKFHGIYQQHDRDVRRAEARKVHSCMVRVSVPGGRLEADQFLALRRPATRAGDGTLRLTSRGGVQYHCVGKRDLRDLIRSIHEAGLSTLAARGDVVRNVVCAAAPFDSPEARSLDYWVRQTDRSLKPKTRAYAEIWLDGERAASLVEEESEPLYGETYLPRKFKIAFTREGDNTADIYSHDLGFVAQFEHGALAGFTFLAGGGMGQTGGGRNTYPRLADEVGFVRPEQCLDVARAVVTIHRDFGDRSNRRRARLKYVPAERGVEWFREELAAGLGELAALGRIAWRPQQPQLADVAGFRLVISALGDRAKSAAFAGEAERRRILFNAADDPAHCRFLLPSVHRQGDLMIAVSASGRCPALAVRLKEQFEREFGPHYAQFLEICGTLRRRISDSVPDFWARRWLWCRMVDSPALARLQAGQEEEARAALERLLRAAEDGEAA